MRIHLWRERAGSQDTRQIHRPTIPARHSLFLRRSPSPSVCISVAALMKLNGPVAAPVSFARGNGAAAASGGYWENFYFFYSFLFNILIIISPKFFFWISPFLSASSDKESM